MKAIGIIISLIIFLILPTWTTIFFEMYHPVKTSSPDVLCYGVFISLIHIAIGIYLGMKFCEWYESKLK